MAGSILVTISTLAKTFIPAFFQRKVKKGSQRRKKRLTAREEWLHHEENKKYPAVLKDPKYASHFIIGYGDTSPIKCVSTIVGSHQPKYAASVAKEFSMTTHTGFTIFVSKDIYSGSSSDGLILERELRENPELRDLLSKYGLLLDGGFHSTAIRRPGGGGPPGTH